MSSSAGNSLLRKDLRKPRSKSTKVSFSMDNLADFLDIKEELPEALMNDNWMADSFWNSDAAHMDLGLDLKQEEPAPQMTCDMPNLTDLDALGDLTDFLSSPAQSSTDSGCSTSGSELNFNSNGLDFLDSLEIKTDLMLSSTLVDDTIQNSCGNRKPRRRDVSVTLSECAEGFLALKDMELLDNGAVALGVSPTLGNAFQLMDTPMATSESDTETGASTDYEDDGDDDEEIDVVSEDVGSSRTRVHTPKHRKSNPTTVPATGIKDVKAGRSLLKAKHQKPQPLAAAKQAPATTAQAPKHTAAIDHVNGDHCYFLARPKPADTEAFEDDTRDRGVLTPSESGEDDLSDRLRAMGYDTLTTPAEVDKRKIVAAVQALAQKQGMIRGRTENVKGNDVKFRFKMRFKSNSPQRSASARSLLIQPRAVNHFHPYTPPKDRMRRKSASKNSHCPPPTVVATAMPTASVLSTPLLAGQTTTRSVKLQDSLKRKLTAQSRMKSAEEKCREIRDMHNRMERQRRVDLKNNYDQLKDCVPPLADVDKASKLNILNKAADYCHVLVSSETKLKKEIEKETLRHQMLRKKLASLMTQLDHGTRLSSGRLSVIKRFE